MEYIDLGLNVKLNDLLYLYQEEDEMGAEMNGYGL